MFPPVAREFFEWRDAGAGLEPEVIAAIAAAFAEEQKAQAGAPAGNGHGHAADPWKAAARQRALRGR
jgi:hypothetical protein